MKNTEAVKNEKPIMTIQYPTILHGDTISRIEVMNVISDFVALEKYIDKNNHITFEPLEQMINSLPSVIQKPIECDVVSREAVLEAVSEGCEELRGVYGRCEERINALPSVNPQPSEHFIDGVHAIGYREGYKDAQKQKSGFYCDTCEIGNPCLYCKHEFEPQEGEEV